MFKKSAGKLLECIGNVALPTVVDRKNRLVPVVWLVFPFTIDHEYVQLVKKKRWNNLTTFIYFNTNCRKEMKLVPINIDYYLLQFDSLNFP